MPSSESPQPYGSVQTLARAGAAFVLLSVTTLILAAVCLPLLPWHATRVELGGRYGRWIAPILLRILGWRLDVRGREHVETDRPALYAINHSSFIDTVASMAFWPPRSVAIGKRSLLLVPGFGQAFLLMGNLLIDRSNRARAVASMQRMTATMQRLSLSTLMAPEGTRSTTGALGPFKKGFAHIAIAAGIPIVPVVFHNAAALWPHRSMRLTPGVIEVTILPPIPTTDWTVEGIPNHVETVRAQFVATLEAGVDG